MKNGKFNIYSKLHNRRIQTFLVGFFCGVVGVCIDADHILCIALGLSPFDIGKGIYGCRLIHPYLIYISGGIIGVVVALSIGLFFYLVYLAVQRRTFRIN